MTKKPFVLTLLVVVPLGAVLILALVLQGNGSVRRDSAGSAASDGVRDAVVGSGGATTGSSGKSGAPVRQAVAVTPLARAVISTGEVTMQSADVARARSEIVRLVTSWGGMVADEQSGADSRGRLVNSTLTLRVPSARFDDAMTALGTLGDVEQQSRKSEDVTTRVIDNDARVRAAERSIQQIEALLSRAQKLGDIIAIESDLARRQADLDSLRSQQAWLSDQTSLSTVNVYLSRPVAHPVLHETKGFLTGLENGWRALGGATSVLLTAVGAVLPFGVVLVVLGVPLWLVVRRRWGRVSAGSAPARSA